MLSSYPQRKHRLASFGAQFIMQSFLPSIYSICGSQTGNLFPRNLRYFLPIANYLNSPVIHQIVIAVHADFRSDITDKQGGRSDKRCCRQESSPEQIYDCQHHKRQNNHSGNYSDKNKRSFSRDSYALFFHASLRLLSEHISSIPERLICRCQSAPERRFFPTRRTCILL